MQTYMEKTNKEIDQDRVEDTVDHFRRFGYVMFHQQVKIYQNIAKRIGGWAGDVIEAGCGNGLGTAIIDQELRHNGGAILGTDKLLSNVKFAQCLYPWIPFDTWDINEPSTVPKPRICVCVETFEHVANPQIAMDNLLKSCTLELWISTPNGKGADRPPSNPYHVCEYTPQEIISMASHKDIYLYSWENFDKTLPLDTGVNPLVYRIVI